MQLTKRYLWKILSEDGLLKDPMHTWGDCIFNRWGYQTKEDAITEFQRLMDIGLHPPTCILIEEYSTFQN
jgi:hypothetical protein